MKRSYIPFLLLTAVTAPAAFAQQTTPAATTQPMFATAEVEPRNNYWYLNLADGTQPNPGYKRYTENGKERRFADEAAILNFLYEQGWDIQPNGVNSHTRKASTYYYRYLLKRRNP